MLIAPTPSCSLGGRGRECGRVYKKRFGEHPWTTKGGRPTTATPADEKVEKEKEKEKLINMILVEIWQKRLDAPSNAIPPRNDSTRLSLFFLKKKKKQQTKNSCANSTMFLLRESPLRHRLSAIKSQSRSFGVGCVMDEEEEVEEEEEEVVAIAILIAH